MEGGVQSRSRRIAPFQRSLKLYLLISPIRIPYRLPQLIGELVGQMHDRMPAILEPKGYDRWLGLEPNPHDSSSPDR
jgi:hypothetical protein